MVFHVKFIGQFEKNMSVEDAVIAKVKCYFLGVVLVALKTYLNDVKQLTGRLKHFSRDFGTFILSLFSNRR